MLKLKLNFAKFIMLFGVALFVNAVSFATPNEREISALTKIISMSKDIPAGKVDMAVVYDASVPESSESLNQLTTLMESMFEGPRHTISLVPITADSLFSVSKYKVVFLTDGLTEDVMQQIKRISIDNRILTMSTNLACVYNDTCVIGIEHDQFMNIILSNNVYKASKLRFNAAFKFIVKVK